MSKVIRNESGQSQPTTSKFGKLGQQVSSTDGGTTKGRKKLKAGDTIDSSNGRIGTAISKDANGKVTESTSPDKNGSRTDSGGGKTRKNDSSSNGRIGTAIK